tara:strand:+ start:1127 stop:2017 length:891 start_codon:yes stop_codon:yes gene_type:complete
MDATRYAAAAQLVGVPITEGTLFKDMRAIVALRAPVHTEKTPSATTKKANPKEPPDENVFRANYEGELDAVEIANQWNFLKEWTLKPTDLAIEIGALEENKEHLLTNGWCVVLKEMSHWYFRKESTDAPVPTADAPAESSADLIEKQETEYAISQVADYERDQAEKKADKTADIVVNPEDPAAEFLERMTTAVATAIDDSNRAYKRRIVTGLAMNDELSSLSAIHEFAKWIFDSQEPCTTLEKRRFQEFWKGTTAPNVDGSIPSCDGEKPTSSAEDGEKKPIAPDDGEKIAEAAAK